MLVITHEKPSKLKKMLKNLGFWVIIGIIAGICLGLLDKEFALASKIGVDYFIQALKILIGPIIFLTIVLGVISLESLKQVGSIGAKALLYFEIVSTFALAIGIFMANIMGPGKGMNLDPSTLDQESVAQFVNKNIEISAQNEILHILKDAIPTDIIAAFSEGKTLQILVIALACAFIISLMRIDERKAIQKTLEIMQSFVFKILEIIMYFSPIAAFSAMAFLVAKYGLDSLLNLGYLLIVMLLASLLFIFGVLGLICFIAKVNIFKFMRFISREVLIVFATSSSESALAPLMRKLEKAGISKATVGLVLPTGYSFNLDCTNIYLAMSLIFLAQAFNVELSLTHEISILIVLMIASKGAVGVTGSGFIILGSTLAALSNMHIAEANNGLGASLGEVLPVAAISILLGVDKFMSEIRAVGNLCGNSVAALIVAIWDKQIDWEKFRYALDNPKEFTNAGFD
ncbi:cation:dicarboxylase symporter family transporter [Campylobacter sp. IFREMER_LSEM_CL1846]|uniref:cation:dicarboxylate symporter family transporter n=1 Tax=unclassified Campylobacter TaxID=2593542 RepID=UPI0021E69B93|nr:MULTISPECIES: cation:dicarboxylase symporter family transporter [unclassified Campylobacter]MCV3409601.1 cation:dicarboxylase symporter family transporter [Campylobacter sp. IFREMER_LSEM_CL1890]MCV3434446.1 cation:dicarboxylase symporter family transporter [Campylobacter sp. IFREMER_LSEM_CL1846]MCV3456677.1 cation:dicarboxylase symporter family transporter [Campylobacter sp. CNRCH_2016_0050h]MCV3508228.1 cation:dicarboxylase symporter family transporter [Campylobacter sp. CNRCH_2016_3089]MC